MNRWWLVSIVNVLVSSTAFAADAPTVRLHSAGSLRAAMTDITAAYNSAYGPCGRTHLRGASGGLGDRLAKGEAADVSRHDHWERAGGAAKVT
jgi:ABC-type molybdate transport system substrate-binding protein